MKANEIHEDIVAKALFDTLSEAEARALEAHLAACPPCAGEVAALRRTLGVAAERVRPEPSPDFWEGYADRLGARLAAEQRRRPAARLGAWREAVAASLAALVPPVPRWTLHLAAAVALVAFGILLGRTFFGAAPNAPLVADDRPPAVEDTPAPVDAPEDTMYDAPGDTPGVTPPAILPPVDEPAAPGRRPARRAAPGAVPDDPSRNDLVQPAVLEDRTLHYIDRSKVLLLGLVNFDPAVDDPAGLDLPRRQAAARRLVDEADGLKDDLAAADQQRLRGLIGDLEVILLQIANLEAEHDVPAIELVKSGVDRRAILLKINVEEMRLSTPPADDPNDPNETAPKPST